jgi:hypothetical protein
MAVGNEVECPPMSSPLGRSAILALAAAMLFASAADATLRPNTESPDSLYFALEVRQGGRLLAHPKLLAEAGKTLRVERRQPGSSGPDYRFSLLPVRYGEKYRVDLALQLPDAEGHSALALLPGEVRKVELGREPGDLEISLLLMRVDSPEFRAMMDLAADKVRAQGHGSI